MAKRPPRARRRSQGPHPRLPPYARRCAPAPQAVSAALSSFTKSLGPDGGAALAESVAKSVASAVTVTENGKPVPGFK